MKSSKGRQVANVPGRIAVTGAAGFLGRHTVQRLAGMDAVDTVLAVDLQEHDPFPSQDKVVYAARDIRDPMDDLLRRHSVQAIAHLAYVIRPARDRAWARSINVAATEKLLQSCVRAGVEMVVYPSSATVYGARRSNHRPFLESDAPNPVPGFQYSEDKVAAETLIERWRQENPTARAKILRGCVVMGPGADNFIMEALKMKWLPVPAREDPPVQFLHVEDLLDAFERALGDPSSGIYNIAGEGSVRWRRMARLFGNRAVPLPGPLLKLATDLTWRLRLQSRSPAPGVNLIRYPWLVSTDRIRAQLGWRAQFTSEEALVAAREPAP